MTRAEESPQTTEMMALVRKTFGSEAKAMRWLERPTEALSGMAPIALLDTPDGFRRVQALLSRIDQGLAV